MTIYLRARGELLLAGSGKAPLSPSQSVTQPIKTKTLERETKCSLFSLCGGDNTKGMSAIDLQYWEEKG